MIAARLLPSGDRAVLVELDGLDEALALRAALESSRPAGVLDLVPAARTVLVVFEARELTAASVSLWIQRTAREADRTGSGAVGGRHEIAVRYDGADLAELADALDWSIDELVRRHCSTVWRAAFGGFAPGFAYLVPLSPWPEVARRAAPRTRVPAGAVALAAGWTGIYPRSSPGGWQLIGSTEAVLWDVERVPPALLAPGDEIRFRALP